MGNIRGFVHGLGRRPPGANHDTIDLARPFIEAVLKPADFQGCSQKLGAPPTTANRWIRNPRTEIQLVVGQTTTPFYAP